MVSEKAMNLQNTNLDQPTSQIQARLKTDGYKTQYATPLLGSSRRAGRVFRGRAWEARYVEQTVFDHAASRLRGGTAELGLVSETDPLADETVGSLAES